MSHLFQPGNLIGREGGRPPKYTKEFIDGELEAFKEWMSREDSVYLKNFAVQRGYNSSRLYEFAEEHEGFAETFATAKEWQEGRLIQFGLFRKTDAGLTKFILAAVHKFKEPTLEEEIKREPIQITIADARSPVQS